MKFLILLITIWNTGALAGASKAQEPNTDTNTASGKEGTVLDMGLAKRFANLDRYKNVVIENSGDGTTTASMTFSTESDSNEYRMETAQDTPFHDIDQQRNNFSNGMMQSLAPPNGNR